MPKNRRKREKPADECLYFDPERTVLAMKNGVMTDVPLQCDIGFSRCKFRDSATKACACKGKPGKYAAFILTLRIQKLSLMRTPHKVSATNQW